jgi:chromosome segregation protein
VRRRDVADIFLGTGLGSRAYAIIEQGMISRVIEAKPEELRVFLEEAAGVSKYRERRRETELRLKDTRENLLRVDDIRRELELQIAHLQGQAEVTRRYHDLQGELHRVQGLLWLTRKQEAAATRARQQREIERLGIELEAETARLREAEKRLEEMRAQHYRASDEMHAAQGALYEANAQVSRLEQQIAHVRDNRQRIEHQLATLQSQLAHSQSQLTAAQVNLREREGERETLQERLAACAARAAAETEKLPVAEEAYRTASRRRDELQQNMARIGQTQQVEQTKLAHARRLAEQLAQRRERLLEERGHLGAPDEQRLQALQSDAARVEGELAAVTERQRAAHAQLAQAQGERQGLLDARTRETDTLARLEARLQALRELQASVEADEKLDPWLRVQGLESLPRLFRRMQVDAGWEVAFEAVLRDRIEGLEVSALESLAALAADAPPARVAFYTTGGAVAREAATLTGFARLSDRVRGHDAALAAVLGDWLAGVFVADDLTQALAAREQLPPVASSSCGPGTWSRATACASTRPTIARRDLLARRQGIENLEKEQRAQKLLLEQAVGALARCEAQLRQATEAEQADRQAVEQQRAQLHARQLEIVRLAEMVERVRHRGSQIEAELAEIDRHEADLQSQREEAERRFGELDLALAEKQQAQEAARVAYEEADRASREGREQRNRLATEVQRHEFEFTAARDRRGDVLHAIETAAADAARLLLDQQAAQAHLQGLDDTAARTGLDTWLAQRAQAEEALREARSRLDELTQQMRGLDEARLLLERDVQPRRDRITELQLKEQAARLAVEQFAQLLADVQADEAALGALMAAKPVRAGALQAEIMRLAQEIEALGAVNLAALQELETNRSRKGFLDAQSAISGRRSIRSRTRSAGSTARRANCCRTPSTRSTSSSASCSRSCSAAAKRVC